MALVSERKILANRQNALKSTGPKDFTIVKFNALKHGLRAASILLHGEDPELFEEIKKTIYDKYNPEDLEESQLADQIVQGMWMRRRAYFAERALLQECENAERKIQWRSVCDHDYLEKMAGYRLCAENSIRRGTEDLIKLQEKRRKVEDGKNGFK